MDMGVGLNVKMGMELPRAELPQSKLVNGTEIGKEDTDCAFGLHALTKQKSESLGNTQFDTEGKKQRGTCENGKG
jgi:hypothetical protein